MAEPTEAIPGRALRQRLLRWYDVHHRELPWRGGPQPHTPPSDAYKVWISEVMLQQTRVAAVIPYYQRFLARFPDPAALARAAEADVLAAWSGLGYYRRARQLHVAARAVVASHAGALPLEPAALRALPGIGDYTAAAILSIAAGQPVAAVDGNVVRVASRLLGRALAPAEARAVAQGWIPPDRPGDFNQALMDLGATLCLPRAPQCRACPLHRLCRARGDVPNSRPRPKPTRVTEHYALMRRGGRIRLTQRPVSAGRMAGMWELPRLRRAPGGAGEIARARHSITRYAIVAHLYGVDAASREFSSGRWVTRAQARELPLTGLCRKLLKAAGCVSGN